MEQCCKTPIALIFFNRPDTLAKVFERVRAARPEKLFLIQDGPRNEKDVERIMQCREIVDNIDWECNVVRDYSEVNLGCGVRPQSGITNAFKQVDRLIILEDDCVAEESFFDYCTELLERYRDDERICYISGINHFESWDCGDYDYFFAKTGAIAGWATWRRAWTKYYDYYVKDISDTYSFELTKKQISNKYISNSRAEAWKKANLSLENGEKLSYWDAQWGYVKYSQNMLVIVPRYNQITNIGVGAYSTHATSMKKEEFKKYKNFVFIPTKKLDFPLKNPKCVVCDVDYDDLLYKCTARNPIRRTVAKFVKKLIGRK